MNLCKSCYTLSKKSFLHIVGDNFLTCRTVSSTEMEIYACKYKRIDTGPL